MGAGNLDWMGRDSERGAAAPGSGQTVGGSDTAGGERRLLWLGPRSAERAERTMLSLAQAGFVVTCWSDAEDALHAFVRDLPDLIVVDARADAEAGGARVAQLREVVGVPIVVVGETDAARCAESSGAFGSGAAHVAASELERLPSLVRELVGLADPTDPTAPGPTEDCAGALAAPRPTAAQVRTRARIELRDALARELVACRGNLAEVGRRLGKDRSTVRYHLRRFGMLGDAAD